MKNFKIKHFINYALVSAFLIYGVSMYYTTGLLLSNATLLAQIGYSIILAVSLNLVVGFLGELSLGHAGFMCIGGYIGGLVGVMLKESGMESKGLVLIAAIIVGGLFAAFFGFVIGLPSLRLKGDYLAIVTLAFGEIVRNVFMNQKLFGGPKGLSTDALTFDTRREPFLYIYVFVLALIMIFAIQNLIKSKHGRAITAIRDNEIAAKAMGINVTFYKLFVFVIAAFFAGCAGAIYAHVTTPVKFDAFSYNYSIEILVMVVLGGMGNISGSIIAAAFITIINNMLQNHLSGDLALLKNLVYAIVLIVVVVFSNAPSLKNFRERYNIGAFFTRFRKKDASVRKDDEAKWARVPSKIKMDAVLSTDVAPNSNDSIHGDISANDGKGGKD